MSSASRQTGDGVTADYVAPALIVLGRVRDLTEFNHHHHHHHHHQWDGPNGLHPPGLPPRLFNGSA